MGSEFHNPIALDLRRCNEITIQATELWLRSADKEAVGLGSVQGKFFFSKNPRVGRPTMEVGAWVGPGLTRNFFGGKIVPK